jgi:hypothetical protein
MHQVARIRGTVSPRGLFVDVEVGVSIGRRAQLWKKSRDVPPAVFATFIIDTGADTSMVDDQIMRTLGLSAVNQRKVVTSQSKGIAELCEVYDIGLEVLNRGFASWCIPTLPVLARPLMDHSLSGMLGRDVLDTVVLTYDGPLKTFTIDYRA